MKRYNKLYFLVFIIITVLSYVHYKSAAPTHGKEKLYTVSAKPFSTTLSYSGEIEPLKAVAVTSPAEGTIHEIFFHYGEIIAKGQPLFTIVSEKFQTAYKNTLMQYIKTKT